MIASPERPETSQPRRIVDVDGRFTPAVISWLRAEGVTTVSHDGTAVYAVLTDWTGAKWAIAVRALSPDECSLLVVFEPGTKHREIYWDFDDAPEVVLSTLAAQFNEINDTSE